MKVLKSAVSGTMESSDIMVTISPGDTAGIEIDLNSTVEKQFGAAIRKTITETLEQLGIHQARVTAVDKGALDCVIIARVRASAYRACVCGDYVWEVAEK